MTLDDADSGRSAPDAVQPHLRVCIVQQVIPTYRVAVFNALGSSHGIDLSVWAERSFPGVKPTDPTTYTSFAYRATKVRHLGPFIVQPDQLAAAAADFDVVVYSWNTRFAYLIPALLRARRRGIGSVVWGHGVSPDDTSARRALRDRVGTLADARLLYSEAVAEDIRTRSAKPDSVFVAPNAIDQEQVRVASDRWRDSSKLDDFRVKVGLAGTNLFVALSRLRPEKKLSDLIRAVASLRSEGRAVHLAVIGDGIEMASLEELAVSLGIADCVQFLGGLYDEEELAPWCLSAVACVVPASIGLSLLHAFGYALPVITTSDEQTPEIEALRNGENGILVKSQGVDGLVSAMRSLLDDSGTRGRMATAAAATVGEDGFGIPQMVDGMIQAIRYAARVRRSGL